MRQITYSDIRTRLKSLQRLNKSGTGTHNFFSESARLVIESKRVEDIKRVIETCAKSNEQIPFATYMELFDAVIQHGTKNDVRNIGQYITENVVPKTRDAKLTNSLLKGRLTRLQHKLVSPVTSSMDDFAEKLKVDPVTPAVGSAPTHNEENKEVATEAYTAMIKKNEIMHHCDRITENYNRISMRFNIDMLFIENARLNGVEDTICELCRRVDTYSMDTAVKFNTVIETAFYGLESNNIEYDPKQVLETAIDFFLFKEDGMQCCKDILYSTIVYDTDDISIIHEEEPEQESVEEAVRKSCSKSTRVLKEQKEFKKIFSDFKEKELGKLDKPQNKLKYLINKLYAKDVDSVINGTPDLLKWIRRFFILGTIAIPGIGPVIGAVGFIADKFISIHQDREEYLKMLKAFNAEIKESKDKMKTSEDAETKQKLEKYIKSLEDARDKISNAYNEVLSEKEQEERFEHMEDEGYESSGDDDFDFDFNDDDFDFSFEEGALFDRIEGYMKDLIMVENNYAPISRRSIEKLMTVVDEANIVDIAKLAHKYPMVFHKTSVQDGIEHRIRDIKAGTVVYESMLTKSSMISTLEHALEILKSDKTYKTPENIYEAAAELDVLADATRAISIFIDTYFENTDRLLEASFTNTLNVASMKLRNAMKKMSDKDRQISQSMDVGVNNLKKGIERALTNDNRESIIKGSVLPSFSKLVKLGIMNAGLVAFGQPLLAIIATLGYFALNNSFKAKERQMVIDELEIELKICQKYIDIAEQKNDMKALRQLLSTQRELERQRQRIKYKMQVKYGQKYYDAKAPD